MGSREPNWNEPQNPLDPIDPLAESPAETPAPGPRPRARRSGGRSLIRSLVILVIAAGIGGGVFLYEKLKPSQLQLLNGFDVPLTLTVEADGETTTLSIPAHGRLSETLTGDLTVTAETDSGVRLSQEHIIVPRGTDLVVYNVLGAASVYLEEVIYYTSEQPLGLEPEGTVENWSGRSFVELDHVQYVFETPPMEIQVDTSSSEVTRWHFDYLGDGSWMTAVNSLIGMGRGDDARNILDGVLSYDPENVAALSFQSYLSGLQAPGLQPTTTPK